MSVSRYVVESFGTVVKHVIEAEGLTVFWQRFCHVNFGIVNFGKCI
ncbi:hypothetical protein APHNP_1460 [Anaplasma phagocytophilum str. ApNP]|uniref:Uncharacterized protein n=1 Tax=Anaplasma phagocytophilum str. ApNP TaxID=1359153 RepID=A0A0F3NFT5_ANAPH|nr:hypothetical protein APHNP_1460 [Anaplasma phagocytophilum str. ApNP]